MKCDPKNSLRGMGRTRAMAGDDPGRMRGVNSAVVGIYNQPTRSGRQSCDSYMYHGTVLVLVVVLVRRRLRVTLHYPIPAKDPPSLHSSRSRCHSLSAITTVLPTLSRGTRSPLPRTPYGKLGRASAPSWVFHGVIVATQKRIARCAPPPLRCRRSAKSNANHREDEAHQRQQARPRAVQQPASLHTLT